MYLRGFDLETIKTSVGDPDPHILGASRNRIRIHKSEIRILPFYEKMLAKQDFNNKILAKKFKKFKTEDNVPD